MVRLFRRDRPLVRPWALAGPIVVLMLLAPLLRPLWSPGRASPAERVTLEAVRSILRDGTLALDRHRVQPGDPVFQRDGQAFSQDPPAFDAMLAGVGWAIERSGVRADDSPLLFVYLLTLFAVAVPTAIACGLIYRTGRIFEISRPARVGLAISCVMATGWASYATSLRPTALATAGVVAAIAGVIQFARADRPGLALGWVFFAGLVAMAAGVIEPLAVWALPAALVGIVCANTKIRWRAAGIVLLLAGAAAPAALHWTLNRPLVGDWRPPRWHVYQPKPALVPLLDAEDDPLPSGWSGLGRGVGRTLTLTVGEHGLFSHFPVLVLGLAGAGLIVRRHWTGSVKAMAAFTLLSLAGAIIYKMSVRPDWINTGFAAPRLAVFSPALLMWAGAWLRRRHGAVVWTVSGIALAVSLIATIIGILTTTPTDGFSHYTLAEAVERLFR
ncbi:MAG: hypothetical protein QM754_04035 [Tepidisphaeraceae bacterium]